MELTDLVRILHNEQCSCVIGKDDRVLCFHERGVKDLYTVLSTDPAILLKSKVADKVIGKGAAALMILGKVSEVYGEVVSQPAMSLFTNSDIKVEAKTIVPNIINRSGTGICPVESLCMNCMTPEECLPLISSFLNGKA